jgi:hypothetical protein
MWTSSMRSHFFSFFRKKFLQNGSMIHLKKTAEKIIKKMKKNADRIELVPIQGI